jgi:TonB family protein
MSYRKIGVIGSLSIHLLFGIFILNLEIKSKINEDTFFVNLVKIKENSEINKFKKVKEKSEIRNIDKKRESEKNIDKEKDKLEKNFENKELNVSYKLENLKNNEIIENERKQGLKASEIKEEKLEFNLEVSENEKGIHDMSLSKPTEKETIYISGKDNTLDLEIILQGKISEKKSDEKINEIDLNKSNNDFFYYRIVKDRIIKKIIYPEIAKRRNIEGNVKIGFLVLRNGKVEEIKVIKSSKYEILDKNSIDIIKNASPFPEFPDTLNYEKILFVMDFNYKLKNER